MDFSGNKKHYLHSAIGLCLMFGIGFLPPIDPITQIGMQVGGVFIGLLYLWTTVGILWPSLLGLGALALCDCANITDVLAASFGNNVTILMIFILALVGVVEIAGIPDYIIQWIMTRRIIEGRPWLFTIIILIGTYITSVMAAIVAAFLFWSILYKLFEDIGYKKGDKYPKLLIFGVAYATCLGTFLMPFQGMGLLLTGTMQSAIANSTMPYFPYIIVNLVLSLISILIYVLAMRFIFKPDVSLLRNVKTEMFQENKLSPMTGLQKFLAFYLVFMIVALLLPSFLPKSWILSQKLSSLGSAGMILILFAILCIIRVNGKDLVDFRALAHQKIAWELVFLTAMALAISGYLTKPETGISTLLTQILNPIFLDKSSMMFIFLLCLLAVCLTNVANNGVIAMLIMALSCLYVGSYQMNPAIVVILLSYCTNIAFLLPASSMFGAIVHGNEWLNSKDIYVYAIFVAIVAILITVLIGYPLADILL